MEWGKLDPLLIAPQASVYFSVYVLPFTSFPGIRSPGIPPQSWTWNGWEQARVPSASLVGDGKAVAFSASYLPFWRLSLSLWWGLSEKAMAPHSSTPAWKIPWMEEPGGLQSMGSLRVRHDWATSLSLFTFLHWRRKWQPTPVFLPGESQGRGSLVGCRLWGRTESDTTEVT